MYKFSKANLLDSKAKDIFITGKYKTEFLEKLKSRVKKNQEHQNYMSQKDDIKAPYDYYASSILEGLLRSYESISIYDVKSYLQSELLIGAVNINIPAYAGNRVHVRKNTSSEYWKVADEIIADFCEIVKEQSPYGDNFFENNGAKNSYKSR
jgi:hypothetical protein